MIKFGVLYLALLFVVSYGAASTIMYGGSSSDKSSLLPNGIRHCSYSIKNEALYVTSNNGYLTEYDLISSKIKSIYQLSADSESPFGFIKILPNHQEYIGSDLALYDLSSHKKIKQIDMSVKYRFNRLLEYNQKHDIICHYYSNIHIKSDYIYLKSVHKDNYIDSVKVGFILDFTCDVNGDYIYYPQGSNIVRYSLLTNDTSQISIPNDISFVIKTISINDNFIVLTGSHEVLVLDKNNYSIIKFIDKLFYPLESDISPDGSSLAYTSAGTVFITDLNSETTKEYETISNSTMVKFIDNQKLIATSNQDGNLITMIDIKNEKQVPFTYSQGEHISAEQAQNDIILVNYNSNFVQIISKSTIDGSLNWYKYLSNGEYNINKNVKTVLSKDLTYFAIALPIEEESDVYHNLFVLNTKTGNVIYKNLKYKRKINDLEFYKGKLMLCEESDNISSIDLSASSMELVLSLNNDDYEIIDLNIQNSNLWYLKKQISNSNYYSCNYDMETKLDINSNQLSGFSTATKFNPSKMSPHGKMYATNTLKGYTPWIDVFDLETNQMIYSSELKGYCFEFLTDSTLIFQNHDHLDIVNLYTKEIIDTIEYSCYKAQGTEANFMFSFLQLTKEGNIIGASASIHYVFDFKQSSIIDKLLSYSKDILFPNPVSNNTITIEHDNEIPELDRISICDISGVDITNFTFNHTGSETEIYLGEIPPGVYFISYAANGSLYSHKFVVK